MFTETTESTVILTELAAKEINRIIAEQELDADKVRLRVGVKGGGCSGFSYILDLTETQKDSDEVFEQGRPRSDGLGDAQLAPGLVEELDRTADGVGLRDGAFERDAQNLLEIAESRREGAHPVQFAASVR